MLSIPTIASPLTVGYCLFGLASLVLVFVSVVPHNKKVRLLTFIAWAMISLVTLAHYVAWDLTGNGFNHSIPFHLRFGLEGAENIDYYELKVLVGVVIVLLIVSFFCFCRFVVKDQHTRHYYYTSLMPLGLLFAVHPLWSEIYDTYKEREVSEVSFEEYYVTPVLTGGNPGAYPNVVWIYAESFERTYLDETVFPGLTPELTKLEQQSLSCTDVRHVYGTGWTIAGIVSSQCGIPLVTMGLPANDMYRMPHFLAGAKGFGNLLKEKQYTLEFFLGSSARFAGTDKFLTSHGFDVFDREAIIAKRPHYPGEWWGIHDDLMFEFVKDRYAELHKQQQPFVLMVSTIDTHAPHGRVPASFKKRYEPDPSNDILNAVYACDSFMGAFVQDIRKMDTANNTLIVITSDHLSLPNNAYKQLNAGKRRELLLYNWPGKIQPGKIDRPACTFDKGITALHLMGFKSTALGLGRSLVSEQKTFLEQFKDPDEQLKGWESRVNEFWK